MVESSKVWMLANPPTNEIEKDTFELKSEDLPELKDGQVLLQTIFLSSDPAQRGWIDKNIIEDRLYVPKVKQGEVMRAGAVGKVIKSKSDLKEGDLVSAQIGWREFVVMNAKDVKAVKAIPGVSPSIYLGALGGPGLTAYFGLTDVLQLRKGESIVISGAAGAVGNICVQYAKIIGASKIIAIAGTNDKCEWLKTLGADVTINYKDTNFKDQLIKATDGYVDCYFDNVGGSILDLMLTRVKRHGRIAACGAIASYNAPGRPEITNWFEVIANRLTIKGYIVTDYLHRMGEAIGALSKAIEDGQLKLEGNETVFEVPFEKIPETWQGLFTGANQGKLVTKLIPSKL